MSFLTPLYLLGALGLAIPIILHLLHDRPKNKQEFGSLMFLAKTKPPVDRKRRPTHLLLLLLRCLALLLLAFVFARPFVTVDDPADAARRDRQWITVLLDRSASMQRADLWQQAKAGVQTMLGQLGPGDRFTLIAFDDSTELLAEVKSWLGSSSEAEVNAQLERLAKPGFGGSNLGQALVLAGESIQEAESGPDEQPLAMREIVVISDLQKGSRLGDVQGYEWPTGIKVTLRQIGEDDQGNAGIEQVASRAPWAAAEAVPSFRISNSANGIGDELEFLAHTATGETFSQKVHVPPGRSRVVELPGEWAGQTSSAWPSAAPRLSSTTSFTSRRTGNRRCASCTSARTSPTTPRARCFISKAPSKNRVRSIFKCRPSVASRPARCRRPTCLSSAMPSPARWPRHLVRRSRAARLR